MFIKELSVSYFKCIGGNLSTLEFGIPNGSEGSGLNIFLGENNTGKSTIFEAIDFLRNNSRKPIESIVNKSFPQENADVSLVFTGKLSEVVEEFSPDNKKAAFTAKVYLSNEQEHLNLQRTSAGKRPLTLWDNEEGKYVNVAGIDAPLKRMFETNFVWADTNPQDETKFGASTITGNLIGEILNSFIEHPEYKDFIDKFDATFNADGAILKQQLRDIEEKTQAVFQAQFGNGSIKFQFEAVNPSNLFKNVKIHVDDGTETLMEEKGSGMQRAVALAMVQVYADIVREQPEASILKPFFLFIDEPEICLHPKAQEKLFRALLELSKHNQIFISTHSPYFLSSEHIQNISLFICKSGDDGAEVTKLSSAGFFPWSPTWGEINYLAYDMPTVDLHNELYGRLQEISEMWKIKDLDDYLEGQGIEKNHSWTQERNGDVVTTYDVTLMSFIRNKIHHPENVTMQNHHYTTEDLRDSIECMIGLLA